MDLRSMLNEDSVDPALAVRRASTQSQTPMSAIESPVQNGQQQIAGVKRPLSSSTIAEEPPTKKRPKKRRQEKPIWAQKFTEAWHRTQGSKNAVFQMPRSAPTPSSTPGKDTSANNNGSSIAPPPPPQRASSNRPTSSSHQSSPPPPVFRPLSSSSTRPEPTYLNIYPQDELSKTVADFIYATVIAPGWLDGQGDGGWEVEIEAKLGRIIDKNTNARLNLPVRHECVLDDGGLMIAFRSSMTQAQHKTMNEHLNTAVQKSLPRKDSGQTTGGVRRQPMSYKHIYELDRFFQLDSKTYRELPHKLGQFVAQAKQKPRIRVTWDTKTNQVVNKIMKIRLGDLHVFNPMTAFDWRVSASLEVRYTGEVNGLLPADDAGRARNGRAKDRMSYSHQGISIDLTQVTMQRDPSGGDGQGQQGGPAAAGEKELEHELELELPVVALQEEAAKLAAGDGAGFKDLTKLFVDDIRMATRQFPAH